METLGNNSWKLGYNPWKPLGIIHGNLDETWMKLSRNFDKTFMEI
jgi:hypothetical protein